MAALRRPLPGPPRLTAGGDGLLPPASAISNLLDVCVNICLMSVSQMDSNLLEDGDQVSYCILCVTPAPSAVLGNEC